MSIANCWNQAKSKKSPFYQWNPSERGTCHLSRPLENSKILPSLRSFVECREVAIDKNRTFFWDADGKGTCYLLDGEDSQICTSPTGSMCSKNKVDTEPSVEGHIAVRTEFCVEAEFKPSQCDDSTHELPDHPLYECAKLDQDHCIFYKRCVFVNKMSESWASNEFRTFKNPANIVKASSFSYCWRERCNVKVSDTLAPPKHNCSFFSWDPKTMDCSYSNESTEVCLSKTKTIPIFRSGKCEVKTRNPYKSECRDTENAVEFGDPDPFYSCAIKNQNDSVLFYKHYEYNFWIEFVISPWTLTCTLLCIIYILIGALTMILFSGRKECLDIDGEEVIENMIPKQLFSALNKAKLIPNKTEWSEVNTKDVELHVLKYSTGYAMKFLKMNRYLIF